MIFTRWSLVLLGVVAFQNNCGANFLDDATDIQSCMDLCKNCGGTAIFVDNACQCHVADDDQRGAECISRIRRRAQDLGLDVVSCDLADIEADRPARCLVQSPFRRFRSRGDAEVIAKYFMDRHDAGFLGSLLGSANPQTTDETTGGQMAASGTEHVSSAGSSDSGAAIVGSPNSIDSANQMSGQFMGLNPLLGTAANWLQPQTLLAFRDGMQGTQSIVGQPNPGGISRTVERNEQVQDSVQTNNFVGSPHQDMSGYAPSMRTYDSYMYSGVPVLGMSPYSSFVGAPNPGQFQDSLQEPPLESYVSNYNSMVAAQNPSYIGQSPYSNCPTSLVGANNRSSQDKSDKGDAEVVGEQNIDSNDESEVEGQLEENYDKTDGFGIGHGEDVVNSKRITKDAVGAGQLKDQTSNLSNLKQKQSSLSSTDNKPGRVMPDAINAVDHGTRR